MEWNVSNNQDKEVEFNYKIARSFYPKLNDPNKDIMTQHISITPSNVYERTGGVQGQYDSYALQETPFVRGCGFLKMQIKELGIKSFDGDGDAIFPEGEIILGLLNSNPHAKSGAFSLADIKYDIILDQDLSTVTPLPADPIINEVDYILDGVVYNSGYTPKNDDYLVIEIKNGKLELNVYPYIGNDVINLYTTNFDYSNYYYPGLFLVSTNSIDGDVFTQTKIQEVQFMRDQFFGVNKISPDVKEDTDFIGISPPSQTGSLESTNNFVSFHGQDLANFLGFNRLFSGYSYAKLEYTYTADTKFSPSYIPDSIIVELLNIDLKSYDSLDNKRRSILAVIPNLYNNNVGKIIYDVDYPLYISVRNENPIYLRNIRARVLNSDLSPITLKGRAVMTILLK